ncbi:vWA domain-containing protein [Lutispora thermophila]|uniref:Ca-activated chloride channel family protein n=1 Tax=Lutispora thermophila DSM 19022 TaxID=1122184 RepID=A0A1M6GF89_9FIRM|nr:vWA domain-containing protein [Lutispora thermophila]SHJ08615.1 Ca-activated chloride channel family protein [Lutispora thermophila DSM 19022]
MEKETGIIKQMIIITDGKSNIGINPVEAAAKAKAAGITVSAIGIIDNECKGEEDIMEVEAITKAGGGLADYCYIQDLGMTLQVMTQKTVNHTLECIVSKQLKSIIGKDITNMEPQSRMKIVEFIENYGDRVDLLYVILLDTSKSMANKLDTAKKCIIDLMEALKNRKGVTKLALISYPGENGNYINTACDFTTDTDVLKEGLNLLRARGGTPTGPAIEAAMNLIFEYDAPASLRYV